jgi:hypothetical protein
MPITRAALPAHVLPKFDEYVAQIGIHEDEAAALIVAELMEEASRFVGQERFAAAPFRFAYRPKLRLSRISL